MTLTRLYNWNKDFFSLTQVAVVLLKTFGMAQVTKITERKSSKKYSQELLKFKECLLLYVLFSYWKLLFIGSAIQICFFSLNLLVKL